MAIRNYEQILHMAGISVWEYDAATDKLQWDDTIFQLSGRNFDGTRESWVKSIHPDDRKATVESFAQALKSGTPFSLKYRFMHLDDGRIRHIFTRVEAIKDELGRVVQLTGVSRDCTHEEQARQQQERLQHFNELMIESLAEPAFIVTDDGIWLSVNEAVCRYFGVTRSEVIGRRDSDFLNTEQLQASRLYRKKFFDAPDGVHDIETPSEIGGVTTIFHSNVRTYFDEVIGKRCLIGVSHNLTRVQRDYQNFKNLGQMVESSSEFHGYFTLDAKPVFINPAGYRDFGINPLKSLRAPVSKESFRLIMRTALPKVLRGETWTGETLLTHDRTGEKIPCMQKIFAICDSSGKPCYIGTNARDLREDKRRESALVHSSRMASLGTMASGIAHEINNPLTAIMAKAYLLKRMMTKMNDQSRDEELKQVERIEELSRRISQIVNSMRLLARQEASREIGPVPLEKCFEELKLLCHERMVRHQIELTANFNGVQSLIGSESQLVQVLINLCNNAVDAIEFQSPRWIRVDITETDSHCRISVTDSGLGIPAEIAQKMLEPFFTTKAPGAGTGLGLSVSKSLVETMGGRLYYDAGSANTCFVVELGRNMLAKTAA